MSLSLEVPEKSTLFKPVVDGYGNRLALVFGNEAKDGKCPFYNRQCNHCDIGAGEGIQFNYKLNQERLAFFKTYYEDVLPKIIHLIIYNSGSILNKVEMSPATLKEVLDYANSLEQCQVISLDSREVYITQANLDRLFQYIRPDRQIQIILGIESQSEDIRINKLNKLMSKEDIERSFALVQQYNGKIGFDFNIVFQPPEIVGIEAINEATKTVEYGLNLSQQYNVPIDFNFHPYYPSTKSQKLFPHHPRAELQDALQALISMKKLINSNNSKAKIFIGWQDESHDREQDKRKRELTQYIEIFNQFNIHQNIAILNHALNI